MKKIILIALGLGLLAGFTSVSSADDAADKKAARKAAQLKKYDKDGDGKLDEKEKAAMKEDQQKKKKGDAPKPEEKK